MNKFKQKSGFTLIELVVAVGVLAVVMAFSGVIFEMTAETRQISSANSEIMDKFRTIKRQLDADFSGLRKDSPVFIWFDIDPDSGERFDEIMFFANGDFQSIQTYYNGEPDPDEGSPISGNTARVWYGQGHITDGSSWYLPWKQTAPAKENKVTSITARTLSRRQHLLTADDDFDNYSPILTGNDDIDGKFAIDGKNYLKRDLFEHDYISLSQWQVVLNDGATTNVEDLINVCMPINSDFGNGRSEIELDDPNTYHLMFAEGVSSFAVQWGYRVSLSGTGVEWRWFPSDDPAKDGSVASDFDNINDYFGVCFNTADPDGITEWYRIGDTNLEYEDGSGSRQGFSGDFFPQALKFTFRIYDEKGVIEGGRKFSYIVYLD